MRSTPLEVIARKYNAPTNEVTIPTGDSNGNAIK